jgi:hypothetical protein
MAKAAPELPLSPEHRNDDGQGGAADIGGDFYINRGLCDVDTASSLSSISGVVAGESNLQFTGQSTGKTIRATLVGRGRFPTLGMKGTMRLFQVQLDTVEASPSRETIESDVNVGSPWYIADSPRGVVSIETALCSPDQNNSKESFTSSSDGEMIDVPKTRLITSRKRLDDFLRVTPPFSPPSSQSHHVELGRHISNDFEDPRQSKIYGNENSTVDTNEGFLAYIGEKISHTSCRMKLFLAVGLIVFLVCIIAIMAESLTIIGNNNIDEDAESYQVDYPYEDANNIPPGNYFPIELEGNSSSKENDLIFDLGEEPAGTKSLTPSSSPSFSTDNSITEESPSVHSKLPTASTIAHSESSKPSIGVTPQTPSLAQIVLTTISNSTSVTSKPSIGITSQTPPSSALPTTTPSLSQIVLTPSSDTKIVKDYSAISYGKDDYLTVEGMRGASSYLRFDIAVLSGKAISVAILRLYSILPADDEMIGEVVGGLTNVNIDFLPFAGTWDESLVTFDNQIIPFEAVSVGSFSVEGYPYEMMSSLNNLRRVHEVDVTETIRSSQNLEGFTNVTFMLYSDDNSRGSVDFASTEYSVSFGGPKLVIDLSETDYPTASPRTSAPVSSPTMQPSIPPTPKPKTSPAPTPLPFPKTLSPTPFPFDKCAAECEIEVTDNFDHEDHIDTCIAKTQDCDRQCKNECKFEAKKAQEEALTLCKEMC